MQQLKTEFLRLKHKYIILTAIGMIAFQLIWLLFIYYLRMDESKLATGWISTLYQFPMINSLLFPTFLAVLASRLTDIEHKGNTFKQLLVYEDASTIFSSKALCGLSLVLLMLAIQFGFILLSGSFLHFTDFFNVMAYMEYFIATLLASATIFLLQLDLSLVCANQVIPFIVGLSGSLLGVFLMFFSWKLQALLPWGGYIALMPALINWDTKAQTCQFYYTSFNTTSLINLILMCLWPILLWLLGSHLLKRRQF